MNHQTTSALQALMLMYNEEKGDALKKIEKKVDVNVEPHQPYLIRLDGCSFSTFLRGVVKPFDYRITDAMVKTTADLVSKFQPTLGYTSSDEISLIFLEQKESSNSSIEPNNIIPAKANTENIEAGSTATKKIKLEVSHPYNGRIQKLASVASGFASSRFNYHLTRTYDKFSDLNETTRNRLLGGEGYFDARVIPCPNHSVLVDTIFWRSNFDAFRNSISQISLSQFDPKSLHGLSIYQQLRKLENEKGLKILEDYHPRFLFGTWVKKQNYCFTGKNTLTNEDVVTSRTRIVCGSFNWADWNENERLEFALAKFWPDPKSQEGEVKSGHAEKLISIENAGVKKKKKQAKQAVVNNGCMENPPPIDKEFSELIQIKK